jgi:hypothetical protein
VRSTLSASRALALAPTTALGPGST